MKLTIKKNSLYDFFVGIFLLILFTSPIIRHTMGFHPYLVIAFFISLFTFLYYFRNKGKYNSTMYIPLIILFGMLFYIIITQSNKINSIFFSIISIICMLSSYWVLKQDKNIVLKISFLSLLIFYIFFVFSGIQYGFDSKSVNTYLLEGSRNMVATIALFLQIFYSANYYRLNKKLPLFTPLLTLCLIIFTFSRSGIILAITLLFFTYLLFILQNSGKRRILFFIICICLFFIILLNIESILEFLILNTNFDQGFDSPRHIINQEYFNKMSLDNFLIGIDLSSIPIIEIYNNNPHNSFIFAHSQFGIIYIIYIIFFTIVIFYMIFKYQNTVVYGFLILLFLVRISLDMISLLGIFDYIFYFLVFCLIEKKYDNRF